MKTGIEKFKNVMNPDTCDLLIKHLEDNIDKCDDLNHSNKQNVVCKEIMLEPNSELDTMVLKTIEKALASYSQKYPFFQGRARTGYQLYNNCKTWRGNSLSCLFYVSTLCR